MSYQVGKEKRKKNEQRGRKFTRYTGEGKGPSQCWGKGTFSAVPT